MAVKINQDRSVGVLLAPSPVINTQTTDRLLAVRMLSTANHLPPDGVVADKNREPIEQASAWKSTSYVSNCADDHRQSLGAPCIGTCHAGKALTKYLSRAVRLPAPVLVKAQPELHRTSLPRHVGKLAAIPAVRRI